MTIRDIAKNLGISPATVSKALNNATDINADTRTEVLSYINTVGYTNKKFTAVRKKICVFFEDVDYSSSLQVGYGILSGFQSVASAYNYEVAISSVNAENKDIDYDNEMRKNNYAGGFIIGANLKSPLYRSVKNTSYPTLILDNLEDNPNVALIGTDNSAIQKMADLLMDAGHTRIGFLCGEKESAVTRERLAYFLQALTLRDIQPNLKNIWYGTYKENCADGFIGDIIKSKVTAVVCACDLIAIGLIKALKKQGLQVPQDISVTGFDDIEAAKYFSPGITTVHQNFAEIGKTAFVLLRQMIKGIRQNRVLLRGDTVLRESVAPTKN